MPDLPTRCNCCGAYSLAPDVETTTLLAVCDVLVIKALDKVGNRIVRAERARHNKLKPHPTYVAHTIWGIDDAEVDKALKGAWDVVPFLINTHGCCSVTPGQVERMLDQYVHDIVVAQYLHDIDLLAERFEHDLGIPVRPAHHEQGALVDA